MANTLYGLPVDQVQGKVTQCPGGVFIKLNGYSYFVPNEVDDSTSAFIYYPGSGGAGNDAAVLRQIIQGGTPNQIIIIADSANENINVASNRYFNLIQNIGNENGASITNISTMGFSAGGPNTFNGLINNIASHPDSGPQNAVFVDVVGFNSSLSQQNISLLKQNNASLMFLEPVNTITNFEQKLASSGVDVVVAWAGSGHNSHIVMNREFFQNGIVDLTSGNVDTLANSGIYTFVKYNPNTNQWEKISMEEVAEKFAKGVTVANDPFKYYKKLGNLSELQCNNSFIGTKVNLIRNAIKNTNFLTNYGSTDAYASTTKVPNCESDLIQNYIDTSLNLLTLLEKDTVQLIQIGNSIQEVNRQLGNEASNLNANVNYQYYNNSGGVRYATPNNNYYYSVGGTVPTRTIGSMISSMNDVSANKKEELTDKKLTKEEKIKKIKEEFLKYDELYSDDEKIVFEKEDEYKVVIHYDGDEVLTLEYYFDYKTEEAAKDAVEEIKKQFEEETEDVVNEGQYVKVIFDDDIFNKLTLDEVKDVFKDLKELVKEEEE